MTTSTQGRYRAVNGNYERIARVYDQFEHREIVTSFCAALRPTLRARPKGTWILDLACGTGVLSEKLARSRVRVIGVDRSPEMLKLARHRCRSLAKWARFDCADLTSFRVAEACTVATATGEVFNQFTSIAGLVRVFRSIRRNLEPGGVLVFEAPNRFCYEEYWCGRDYLMEGESGDLAMICEWDPSKRIGSARLVGYALDGEGKYEKIETELVERYYSDEEFSHALAQAGFEKVEREPWSPWPDQHLEPSLDRNLWTARKPMRRSHRE